MKLTSKQLKKIIIEELRNIVAEMDSQSTVKRAPTGYSLWDGRAFHALPMDMPEGIPASHMPKLTQLAASDPVTAAELASSFGAGEQIQEITDFFYDVGISQLTKDRKYDVQIDDTDREFFYIVIYEDMEGDGALVPVADYPMGTPKSQVYNDLKMIKQGNY